MLWLEVPHSGVGCGAIRDWEMIMTRVEEVKGELVANNNVTGFRGESIRKSAELFCRHVSIPDLRRPPCSQPASFRYTVRC